MYGCWTLNETELNYAYTSRIWELTRLHALGQWGWSFWKWSSDARHSNEMLMSISAFKTGHNPIGWKERKQRTVRCSLTCSQENFCTTESVLWKIHLYFIFPKFNFTTVSYRYKAYFLFHWLSVSVFSSFLNFVNWLFFNVQSQSTILFPLLSLIWLNKSIQSDNKYQQRKMTNDAEGSVASLPSHQLGNATNISASDSGVLVSNATKIYGAGKKRCAVLKGFDMIVKKGTM